MTSEQLSSSIFAEGLIRHLGSPENTCCLNRGLLAESGGKRKRRPRCPGGCEEPTIPRNARLSVAICPHARMMGRV